MRKTGYSFGHIVLWHGFKLFKPILLNCIILGGVFTVHSDQRPLLRNIIWKLLIFVFLILTIYVTYTEISEFFTYPFSTQLEISLEHQKSFPAVTVCNQNQVRCTEVILYIEGVIKIRNKKLFTLLKHRANYALNYLKK